MAVSTPYVHNEISYQKFDQKTRQDYKSYLKQDDELKRAARGNDGRCEAFARFAFYKTSESQEVNKEREMFDQV